MKLSAMMYSDAKGILIKKHTYVSLFSNCSFLLWFHFALFSHVCTTETDNMLAGDILNRG